MKYSSKIIESKDVRNQVNRFLPRIKGIIQSGKPLPLLVTCRTVPVDILRWLKSHSVYPRLYWYDRKGSMEIGGYGSLMTVSEDDPSRFLTAFGKLSAMLDKHPQKDSLRFLGGMSFSPQEKQDNRWKDFPGFWFVLPEVMMLRINEDYFVSAGVLLEGHEDVNETFTSMLESLKKTQAENPSPTPDQFPAIITRTDHPDYAGWTNNVDTSLHEISEGKIDKVVLARRTDLLFEKPVDAVDYLHALKDANDRCYCFLLQPKQCTAFLGATPERLFKTEKNLLVSEAACSTVVRGADPDEDQRRSAWLLQNRKELSEHGFVTGDLLEKFQQITKNACLSGQPKVLQLANVQHLVSNISGVLKNGISIGEIVSIMHPTAAVGGYPGPAATSLIKRLEPFGRGWYAGPVGIISHESAEMAVGIRSSLVTDRVISLFTGAGIVQGSTPESEWQEIEDKMSTAFKVLSGGQE